MLAVLLVFDLDVQARNGSSRADQGAEAVPLHLEGVVAGRDRTRAREHR